MAPRRPWTDPHALDRRALAWHGMARLTDRRVIARTPTEVRTVVRILKRLCQTLGLALLAFNVVDTHVHVLVAGDRFRVGEVFRRFEIAVVRELKLGVGFDRCYLKPVESHGYLQNCFRYILDQHAHHATYGDRFLEGSCLHELNGLRVGALRSRVARYLPRFGAQQSAEALGLPGEVVGAWDEPLGGDELEMLVEAATAALDLRDGVGPLTRRGPPRVAVLLAVDDAVPARDVARVLGCHERTVRRYRANGSADRALVTAVRRQLRFRRARELGWDAAAGSVGVGPDSAGGR